MAKVNRCNCGAKIPKGTRYCGPCLTANRRAAQERKNASARSLRKMRKEQGLTGKDEFDEPIYQPWVPKPKPAPIMTEEEQKKINEDCFNREREHYQHCIKSDILLTLPQSVKWLCVG